MNTRDPWPTNPDGSPKKMGDLTPQQQREYIRKHIAPKLKQEFESPEMRAAIDKV